MAWRHVSLNLSFSFGSHSPMTPLIHTLTHIFSYIGALMLRFRQVHSRKPYRKRRHLSQTTAATAARICH